MRQGVYSPVSQSGIALISVLLVLAIATVILVGLSTSRQIDIRRTENLIRSGQAFEYWFSLEDLAIIRLNDDAKVNTFDSFDDAWVTPFSLSVPLGGQLQAGLSDLQGRFNLNNLIVEDKPSERDISRFKRLLALLTIDTGVVDAIIDWIDSDSDIHYPDGAEDAFYLNQAIPYRSSNRAFADVSELLLVKGVSAEIFKTLLPYVYVADGYTDINVNTAPPVILQSLADKLSEDDAQRLVDLANDKPFESISAFLANKTLAGLGVSEAGLGVISSHFLLSGSIHFGRLSWRIDSYFNRLLSGQTRVVKRQRSRPDNG